MKQFLTHLKRLVLLISILGMTKATQAQTYQLYFTNVVATTNTVQWDVYLLRTGATNLELATIQLGMGYDISILAGGTLTGQIVSGFSDLPAGMQPTSIQVGLVNYVNSAQNPFIPVGQTHRFINIAAKSPPGAGSGPSISNIDNGCGQKGTRICRILLTNSVPWLANSHMNHVFSSGANQSQKTTTQVNAYVGTTNTNITLLNGNQSGHMSYNVVGTCDQNITLNFTCPTITVTPTAGPLAGGTIGTPYAGATFTGAGGVGPYTYTVTGGTLPAGLNLVGGSISGTPTGPAGNSTFSITATDANLCSGSTAYSINVVNGCAVTGSGTTTAVSCFGSTDGTATITLTGSGSAAVPGTYTVDGGSSNAYSTNPFTITGLAAGSHTIVATTGSACISTPIIVNVGDVAALTGSGTGSNVSCAGNSDGSIQVTLSASTSGTYSLDGGSAVAYNSNPFTISGLAAGSHTITATSAAGCVSNLITASVGAPAVFAGTGTATDVTCGGGGNNGTATITLTGGNSQAPGTYTLDAGGPVAYTTNPFTITGLSQGNHSIVVTAGACTTAPILVNVGAPATFTATYVKTNLSACNATNDGTITVTPTGGTGPYTYVWSGGYPGFAPGNVASVTNLPIGFYNVQITDAGGCGIVNLTNIHIEFAFVVYITNSGTAANACGGSDGSIILYGNAGVQPYTYSIVGVNGGAYQSSNTFTGLAAGTYTAQVKDAAGCVNTKSVTVPATPSIVVSPFVRNASSCSPDGSIEVYRTGGTPPYTYSKDGTTYQTSNVFSALAAGPYTVYVKDSKGCVGQANATVNAGVGLTVSTVKVNTSTCVNDGSIQVSVTGGVAPYTYSKDGGTTFQPGNAFGGLGAGPYAIVVKDSKGCTGNANVTINLNTIVVTASVVNATSCASNNGQVQLFRTGGYGPYTYSLDGNTYQSSTIFTGVAAGTYTGFVKDSKTCIGTLSGIVVGPTGCVPGFTTKGNTNVKVAQPLATALKVTAYPNPSNDQFTLVLEGYDVNAKVSISITDVLGRKVYQTEGTGKVQYKFGSGFIAGIYSVQVIQGSDKKSLKLVKE